MVSNENGSGKSAANKRQNSGPKGNRSPDRLWLYGRHAVAAALVNPARRVRRILATKNAADWLAGRDIPGALRAKIEDAKPDEIDRALPPGSVHQGLAAEVFELERSRLKDVCANPVSKQPIVILDQITDPQNIGAIFRSAAAFGARAIVVQERRTPPLSGALAKAAAGAVETVPCVKAVNISRSIEALQNLGYFVLGLDGGTKETINDLPADQPVAIVMGAEGAGLRPLVASTCDQLVKIPIAPATESLNVSTAAAIALYEVTRK